MCHGPSPCTPPWSPPPRGEPEDPRHRFALFIHGRLFGETPIERLPELVVVVVASRVLVHVPHEAAADGVEHEVEPSTLEQGAPRALRQSRAQLIEALRYLHQVRCKSL